MEFLIYLAGPIKGLFYNETVSWREYVKKSFEDTPEIVALSPMRAKEFLKGEKLVDTQKYTHPLATSSGIICRDRMDVMRCDLLFINLLGAKEVSIGTVWEIGLADAFRKPIVLVMEEENIHTHKIIKEAVGFIVDDIDFAIELTKSILLP